MKDNYFEELKQTEILREKITTLRDMEEQVGKYYSRQWITKNVLFMTDDEMREMQLQIDQERSAGLYNDPDDPGMGAEDDFDDSEQEPTDDEPADDNTEIDAEESLKVINKTKSFKRKPQK